MAVITISRQFGAGGKTLGEMIANELGYIFLDDVIIQEISKEANVSAAWVKSVERTAGGTFSKFISGMLSSSYMERMVGDGKGYIDENIYIEKLHEVIRRFAEQDNVVLMGRGGQYILNDFKDAYHILLIADIESRIKFIQRFHDVSNAKVEQLVMQGEKRRANLYKKFHRADYNQPHLYHLVLNMDKLSLEKALQIVCLLVQK